MLMSQTFFFDNTNMDAAAAPPAPAVPTVVPDDKIDFALLAEWEKDPDEIEKLIVWYKHLLTRKALLDKVDPLTTPEDFIKAHGHGTEQLGDEGIHQLKHVLSDTSTIKEQIAVLSRFRAPEDVEVYRLLFTGAEARTLTDDEKRTSTRFVQNLCTRLQTYITTHERHSDFKESAKDIGPCLDELMQLYNFSLKVDKPISKLLTGIDDATVNKMLVTFINFVALVLASQDKFGGRWFVKGTTEEYREALKEKYAEILALLETDLLKRPLTTAAHATELIVDMDKRSTPKFRSQTYRSINAKLNEFIDRQVVKTTDIEKLLEKTQGPDMDMPITELLGHVVNKYKGSTHPEYEDLRKYHDWLVTAPSTTEPIPKTNAVGTKLTKIKMLLQSSDRKDKRNGKYLLAEFLTRIEKEFAADAAQKELPYPEPTDYFQYSATDRVAGESEADAAQMVEAERIIHGVPTEPPKPAQQASVMTTVGDKVNAALGAIPGVAAISRVTGDIARRAEAAAEPLLSTEVGSSAVCDPGGSDPSDFQIMMKKALKHTDRYLTTQYAMLGMWALFNLALIGVIFYLLYKTFRLLLSYVQLRRELGKTRAMDGSNNIFDPADDNDRVPVDKKAIAKNRVPSGATIESRLRRLSKQTGTNVREGIHPDNDKYEKPEEDDDDDDY